MNWSSQPPNHPLEGWHAATHPIRVQRGAGGGSPGSPTQLMERPIRSNKSQHLLQMTQLTDTYLIINFEPILSQWTEKLSERSYCSNLFFFFLEIQDATAQLYFSFTANRVHRNNHRLILSHRLCFRSCWNTFSGGNWPRCSSILQIKPFPYSYVFTGAVESVAGVPCLLASNPAI